MRAYIIQLLRESLGQTNPEINNEQLSGLNIDITVPRENFGDYASNIALAVFRQIPEIKKTSPMQLAQLLAEQAMSIDNGKTFAEISAMGGFINFRLSEQYLHHRLEEILKDKKHFGSLNFGQGSKILLEYFQPNMAKPLHLGHISNAVIGDCLFRIFSFTGYEVESDTHLGDWGTQFGLLLHAFKKYGEITVVEKDPINELNKLYITINDELEQNPELREFGKAEFVKLEQGDKENVDLWKKFRDWSWQEYEIVYSELGIRRSDHDWAESFYSDKMDKVVNELKDRKILFQSQGAWIVDLQEYNLGIAVVLKSDGATTYLLRDLATFIYRKNQGFDSQLYVVDIRQTHTLAQTFKILELLGYISNFQEATHIAYGFLTLPEGVMSTRKGTIVGGKEFIQKAYAKALQIIEQKNPTLDNKEQAAITVGNAAIKYFNLARNLKSDVIFEWDKALSFEGNTGPYLQYAHARIYGILRKNDSENYETKPGSIILNQPQELLLLRKLNLFPEIVERVALEHAPNHLCQYLFELSQIFNGFYESCPVNTETNIEIKQGRINLIKGTAQVISNGLNLLGIEAPEQM